MPLLIPAVQAAREAARHVSDGDGLHPELTASQPVDTFEFASQMDTGAGSSRLFVGNLSFDSGDAQRPGHESLVFDFGNASASENNLNQLTLGVHVSPFEGASDWLL